MADTPALWLSALEDIRSHLHAAVIQSCPTDDQIIMDHVRAAKVRADGLSKDLKALGDPS